MKEKIALLSVFANVVLAISKIVVGTVSLSSAILAEGLHSFTDVFASVISYLGIKIAKKPADEKHPYGHYKFEVLAGFLITLILAGTGMGIVYEAYQKFLNPSSTKLSFAAFAVMLFSTLVNEGMAHLKIHFGKKENSVSLLSDGVHSRVDVLASLAVFVGLFLTGYWVYTDAFLAFLIGLYIIKESFSLGKEATDSLLDVSAGAEIEERIRSIAKEQNIGIDSLKTQKKGSAVTVNLEITLPKNLSVEEATRISGNLREKLMEKIDNLSYVSIQIASHEVETGFYKPAFGRGFSWQRKGKFKGQIKEAAGKGPGGWCVCPKCGYKVIHQHGTPCSTLKCPNCDTNLERQ